MAKSVNLSIAKKLAHIALGLGTVALMWLLKAPWPAALTATVLVGISHEVADLADRRDDWAFAVFDVLTFSFGGMLGLATFYKL